MKQFDDAITSEVFNFNIMGVLQEHRNVDLVNTVHELRSLPLGLGGAAMRRNDLHTRTRALRLARDSVARYAKKHEPEALQRIQRVWNRDKMQRRTSKGGRQRLTTPRRRWV
jgi:hypothetical protein